MTKFRIKTLDSKIEVVSTTEMVKYSKQILALHKKNGWYKDLKSSTLDEPRKAWLFLLDREQALDDGQRWERQPDGSTKIIGGFGSNKSIEKAEKIKMSVYEIFTDVFPRFHMPRKDEDTANSLTVIPTRDGKKYSVDLQYETGDRGARQDHGGESGDGWMSSAEVHRNSDPFHRKYDPLLEILEKKFKSAGFKDLKVYLDYGEKGHITIQVYGEVK